MEDSTDTDYHLTETGWVRGTHLFFGKGTVVDPPTNRIETWHRKMRDSSPYSRREDVTWSLTWSDHTISDADRATRRKKFGPPEHDFPTQFRTYFQQGQPRG